MKKTIRILLCITIAWLAISVGLRLLADWVVNNPSLSRNQNFAIPHEQLFVENSAGEKIDMIWVPKPDLKNHPTYLYLHGNAGRLPFIVEGLASHGNVLSPAYPGYSKSTGSPREANIKETLDISIEHLRSLGIADGDVIIFGHSLGGYPAVHAAANYPDLARVILVNTFYNIKRMCESTYRVFCMFAGGLYDTAEIAPMAKAPIRQFHDPGDDIVPFEQGMELFELIGSTDKTFTTLAGTHADFSVEEVLR